MLKYQICQLTYALWVLSLIHLKSVYWHLLCVEQWRDPNSVHTGVKVSIHSIDCQCISKMMEVH